MYQCRCDAHSTCRACCVALTRNSVVVGGARLRWQRRNRAVVCVVTTEIRRFTSHEQWLCKPKDFATLLSDSDLPSFAFIDLDKLTQNQEKEL